MYCYCESLITATMARAVFGCIIIKMVMVILDRQECLGENPNNIITFNYDGKSMVEIETMENGSMVVSLIEEVFQLNCTMTIPPN